MADAPVGDFTQDTKASEAKSPMKIVREILPRFHPLAQVGDTIYRKTRSGLWVDVTDDVARYGAEQSNMCPEKYGIMSALSKFIHIPQASDHCSTPYFKWTVHEEADQNNAKEVRINSRWEPYLFCPDSVAFADGALNVRSGVFQSWAELGYEMFGPIVTLAYADIQNPPPTTRFNEFMSTIEQALPDVEARKFFQKTMGLILQPHVSRKQGVFIVGPAGGRKTTTATAILCAVAGVGGFSIETIDDLADNRYSQAALIGKWANLSDDAGQGRKWVSWFKRYTGSSIMRGEFKFIQPRNYPATAKLIICCNEMPRMGDSSDAIWTRLQVFQFARVGKVDEMFVAGTADDRKLMADYWSEPGTRACILNWLLEGLRLGMTEGRVAPEVVVEWNREGTAEADPVRRCLYDHLEYAQDGFVPAAEILDVLRVEARALVQSELVNYMRNLFPKSKHDRQSVNGQRVRGYVGVKRKG